jgi:hypothetical protein
MNERTQLLRAEARELNHHKAAGGGPDYLRKRALVVAKLYGAGAVERVRELMPVVADGDAQ